MPVLLEKDRNIKLPAMRKVRQQFETKKIDDIKQRLWQELDKEEIANTVLPGDSVALAVGSRGISNIADMVIELVKWVRKQGAEPFIVPAMGSHGGGRAEGCVDILAEYGITEETVGAPIKADEDVVELGTLDSRAGSAAKGIKVYMDKDAFEADKTILINRIKPHTEFNGEVESGLCKLSTIGLGRHTGCTSLHDGGTINFGEIIPAAASMVFDKGGVAFGIAIVENAYDETMIIEAIPTDKIIEREKQLLITARESMPSIGITPIDILIVEEIGKDISGIGMDPNIIGRFGPKAELPYIPEIGEIIALRISKGSHGNACGIGIADFTTRKLLSQMDFEATYANTIACGCDYETEYIPLVMADEEEAIAAAVKTLKIKNPEKTRIVRIRNTADLEEIEVSEPIWPEIAANPGRFDWV